MIVILQDESSRFVKDDDGDFYVYSKQVDRFGCPYFAKVTDYYLRWTILCTLANQASKDLVPRLRLRE